MHPGPRRLWLAFITMALQDYGLTSHALHMHDVAASQHPLARSCVDCSFVVCLEAVSCAVIPVETPERARIMALCITMVMASSDSLGRDWTASYALSPS